jgi:hypothetical protein
MKNGVLRHVTTTLEKASSGLGNANPSRCRVFREADQSRQCRPRFVIRASLMVAPVCWRNECHITQLERENGVLAKGIMPSFNVL